MLFITLESSLVDSSDEITKWITLIEIVTSNQFQQLPEWLNLLGALRCLLFVHYKIKSNTLAEIGLIQTMKSSLNAVRKIHRRTNLN